MPSSSVDIQCQGHPAIDEAEKAIASINQSYHWTISMTPESPYSYKISSQGDSWSLSGEKPRDILAGALEAARRHQTGNLAAFSRKRPFTQRLVTEDFPAGVYAPRGFEFDLDIYSRNLVDLGFTSMECNRFSPSQPLDPYFRQYDFTNPSLAPFVWTPWHEGIWDRTLIEANAQEMDRLFDCARRFDLDPAITSFVPRPYPECFFKIHPHLKGPSFHHEYLKRGGHPAEFCIDTDEPDGMRFYRSVYENALARYPDVRHFFFWHSDLGARFWGDGAGKTGRKLVDRIAEFHWMLDDVLKRAGSSAQVWVNPWALGKLNFEQLNTILPPNVNYSVKDNPGTETYFATVPSKLADATVISASVGVIPRKIRALAEAAGRQFCLGQYQDFSEDLDPVLGVPHPIMTFRKFAALKKEAISISSAHWGILSPDVVPVNPNQVVIREMTWGNPAENFVELFPSLFPAGMPTATKDTVYAAWLAVDHALCQWPQHWALRLQDTGLRLRWLMRPLLPGGAPLDNGDASYYLDHQIYRINPGSPLNDFMSLTKSQAFEVQAIYSSMIASLEKAEVLLLQASQEAPSAAFWLTSQAASIKTLRLFWITYRNMLRFHSLDCFYNQTEVPRIQRQIAMDELTLVEETISHLKEHPETIIICKAGKWGHTFGPDYTEDFGRKANNMRCAWRST